MSNEKILDRRKKIRYTVSTTCEQQCCWKEKRYKGHHVENQTHF